MVPDRKAIPILAFSIFFFSLALSAQELPPGTALEARLSVATSSRSAHAGDPVEATMIAPVSMQGQILVPQGSRLLGAIANATAIGFGLKHSTASITFGFDVLELPNGTRVPLQAQLGL